MPFTKTTSLLLFALLTPTFTLTIPQEAHPAILIAGNNTLTGDMHCYPHNPFSFPMPSLQDCIGAIRRLPSSPVHGTFHDHSQGDDNFGLPLTKTYGPCQVSVGLRGPMPERGTWLELNLAATQLATACADRDGFVSKKGGWTDAGDTNKIRIIVQSTKQVPLEVAR